MDPLSIVASVIAVCQAGDRIGGLLTCIQTLVNAPQEVAALFNEISNIRTALLMLQSRIVMSHWLFPSSGCVHQTLQSCLMHIASLETLVGESVSTTDTSLSRRGENIIKGTKRMTWMRKRRKIGRIKQQLKDALSAIQLELLSLNLLVHVKVKTLLREYI
jgi:hypothetical protein